MAAKFEIAFFTKALLAEIERHGLFAAGRMFMRMVL
jgi:hypothetical protein